MATIKIEKMKLPVIVGTQPHERTQRQDILLNIEYDCNSKVAQKSDNLLDAVDYFSMSEAIIKAVTESSYFLLEKLADHLVGLILNYQGVSRAKVSITKFGVIAHTETVTLVIEDTKQV